MPDLDGFQAAEALRKIDPDVPILMLTSDSRPGEATKCRSLGISNYMIKPVPRAELLRVLCDSIQSEHVNNLAMANEPTQPLTNPEPRALRILVAEDSIDNRFLVERYLAATAHKLTFAETGKIALDLVKERKRVSNPSI